jgi:hypothetical protein
LDGYFADVVADCESFVFWFSVVAVNADDCAFVDDQAAVFALAGFKFPLADDGFVVCCF